jgi:hypothetical protein
MLLTINQKQHPHISSVQIPVVVYHPSYQSTIRGVVGVDDDHPNNNE